MRSRNSWGRRKRTGRKSVIDGLRLSLYEQEKKSSLLDHYQELLRKTRKGQEHETWMER